MPPATTPNLTTRLPNLFIVGVSKAGTTSLFNYLGQHPQVCTSDFKELRYFSPLQFGEALAPIETYSAHFHCDPGQTYAMEATSGYFYGGVSVARGLHDICPDARIVVSFREPVNRCWSFFQFVKSRTRIPKEMSFGEYLDRCEELRSRGIDDKLENKHFWGLGGGCYAQWFDAWADRFYGQFRVVFFDDVAANPHACVKGICDWLSIDSGVVDDFHLSVDNKTEQYYNRRLQKAAMILNREGERFLRRHQATKRILRRSYYSVNRAGTNEKMTAEERTRLVEFYRPYNARLSDQLLSVGITLPASWSNVS